MACFCMFLKFFYVYEFFPNRVVNALFFLNAGQCIEVRLNGVQNAYKVRIRCVLNTLLNSFRGIIILYDKFVNVNIFRWVQERMGWVIIN